jgi:hypothetical protein
LIEQIDSLYNIDKIETRNATPRIEFGNIGKTRFHRDVIFLHCRAAKATRQYASKYDR